MENENCSVITRPGRPFSTLGLNQHRSWENDPPSCLFRHASGYGTPELSTFGHVKKGKPIMVWGYPYFRQTHFWGKPWQFHCVADGLCNICRWGKTLS